MYGKRGGGGGKRSKKWMSGIVPDEYRRGQTLTLRPRIGRSLHKEEKKGSAKGPSLVGSAYSRSRFEESLCGVNLSFMPSAIHRAVLLG